MDQNIYSIYDSKAQAYLPIWLAPNDLVAQRMFGDLVEDGQSNPSKHPEDFTLFRLGSFDPDQGVINPDCPTVSVVSALAILKRKGS